MPVKLLAVWRLCFLHHALQHCWLWREEEGRVEERGERKEMYIGGEREGGQRGEDERDGG